MIRVDWQGVIQIFSYFEGTKRWRNDSITASGFGGIIFAKLPST